MVYRLKHAKVIERDNLLQVIIPSVGCRYRKTGHCIECNYGEGKNIDIAKAKLIGAELSHKLESGIGQLVFSSYGSMFDDKEVSDNVLVELLKPLNNLSIGQIIIETHCDTVSRHKLDLVQECLPDRKISIEMGLESSNPYVLANYIRKKLDLNKLKSTMNLIKSYNMGVELNVLYGIPFLSNSEKETDLINSIYWAFDNGADEVVIFPMNIKPNTQLMQLYQLGKYNRVTHSEFIRAIIKIPDRYLDKIYISSYGDRQYSGLDKEWIPPILDILDEDRLIKWYTKFLQSDNAVTRRNMLIDILNIE